MIEYRDVSLAYDGIEAITGFSWRLPAGALGVLIGTSGAGKSTALRMVNRLVDPSAGTVLLSGTPVMELHPVELRRRIGYVIQSVGLFPHWTIARNIATVPSLLGWPRERIRARVDELLELLRLDAREVRDKYPSQLSGGQQQRVGVARALAADPDVLLMDEPFGALDPLTRTSLQDEMLRIHEQTGKTILFVTHDIDEALKLGDVIALLDHGRLIQSGSPRAFLTQPANDFVRAFVGGDDRGLRLLAIETVRERVRVGEYFAGEPVAATMPLDRALSLMVARGVDRLAVTDDAGTRLGTIHLGDLIR